MPSAAFADLSGHVYSTDLPSNAQIHDACGFLATQLSLDPSQIRILCLSTDSTARFYPSEAPLFPAPRPHFFFQVVISSAPPPAPPLPPALMAVVQKGLDHTEQYGHYSHAVHNVPPDLDARVQRIVEMGFDRGDAEEALRHSRYDPEHAIESLMNGGDARWPRGMGFPRFDHDGPFPPPEFFERYRRGPGMVRPRHAEDSVPMPPPRPRASPAPHPGPAAPRPPPGPRPLPADGGEPPGGGRMTPELRQMFNRIRRRNRITEEGFLILFDDVGGEIDLLNSLFDG
jgi:hypothetical protein